MGLANAVLYPLSKNSFSRVSLPTSHSSLSTLPLRATSPLERTVDALTISPGGFRAGREEVNDDLSQIDSRLPAAVGLVSVTDDSKTLTLNGLADDEAAILGYAQDLRASGRFAAVVMTDMQGEEQRPGFTVMLME